MPYPKTYVDAMLVNWGDRLFYAPLRHVSAPRLSRVRLGDAAARMREQLARTLDGAPEAMVKITNRASGAQGMGAVRRHLRYISRNGQVELEDQDGQIIAGAAALRDLAHVWQFGGWGIPEESSHREVFNVVLSMPAGTDREAVREAARAFAALEFGDGHSYVFAAHDDEAHPHVHLSIRSRGPEGRRLNPRYRDLQRWRERFAEQLRARGIEANATSRRTRGVTRRYPGQAVVHMLDCGEAPRYWRGCASETQRRVAYEAHRGVFVAWREMARTMAVSAAPADRTMAVGIVDFVRSMPVQREAHARGQQQVVPRMLAHDRMPDAAPEPSQADSGTPAGRHREDAGTEPGVER
jgi:hypothetical protein